MHIQCIICILTISTIRWHQWSKNHFEILNEGYSQSKRWLLDKGGGVGKASAGKVLCSLIVFLYLGKMTAEFWRLNTNQRQLSIKKFSLCIDQYYEPKQSFCQLIENQQTNAALANATVWHRLTFCVCLYKSGDTNPTPPL